MVTTQIGLKRLYQLDDFGGRTVASTVASSADTRGGQTTRSDTHSDLGTHSDARDATVVGKRGVIR